MTPLLAAAGLHRRYRARRALDGVDVELLPGRHLGIVGESGSGKSTLLRLLLGLETPDAGTVAFRGRAIVAGEPLGWLRREVQLVPQDPGGSLNPRLPVAESIREPLECLGIDGHSAGRTASAGDHDARVAELLTSVGLTPDAGSRRPAAFSGGERQRVALARALAPRPAVLLADEPFSSVDASTRLALVALMRRLTTTDGLALVLVSHDLGVVERLCDDVVVLDAGRVVEHGTVAGVFADPRAEPTRRLLDAALRLPATPART